MTTGSDKVTDQSGPQSAIDRYFKITQRNSTLAREVRGGLVTFFTMAYIVVLNPIIIGGVPVTPRTPTCSETCCHWRRSPRSPRWSPASCASSSVSSPTIRSASLPAWASTACSQCPSRLRSRGLRPWAWSSIDGIIIVLLARHRLPYRRVPRDPRRTQGGHRRRHRRFIAFIGFVDAGFVRRIPDVGGHDVPSASASATPSRPGRRRLRVRRAADGHPRGAEGAAAASCSASSITTVVAMIVQALPTSARRSTTARAGA